MSHADLEAFSDIQLDLFRCPFTGHKLVRPVMASDLFNYNHGPINLWKASRQTSPLTLQTLIRNSDDRYFVENRRLSDLIESMEINTADYSRVRFVLAVHWLTKFKLGIPSMLNSHGSPLLIPHLQQDQWPLQPENRNKCVQLAWDAYPWLRHHVYNEFMVISCIDRLRHEVKKPIETCFIQSMSENMHATISHQLSESVRMYASSIPSNDGAMILENLEKWEYGLIQSNWWGTWNEKPKQKHPALPVTRDERQWDQLDYYVPYWDLSRPQRRDGT